MGLDCAWELLLITNKGAHKSTCGLTQKPCIIKDCKTRIKPRKAYDMSVPPNSDYQLQAGDRIWAKLKK